MKNTLVITISLPRSLADLVDREAKAQAMNRSEYVRSLVRRKLAFKQIEEIRKVTAPQLQAAGIRTLQDAVRAVREVRSKHGKEIAKKKVRS